MPPPPSRRHPRRVAVGFIPSCFTESLRIPVTIDNRQVLSTLRAAELEVWSRVRRAVDPVEPPPVGGRFEPAPPNRDFRDGRMTADPT